MICIRNTTDEFKMICARIGYCPFGVFPSGTCRDQASSKNRSLAIQTPPDGQGKTQTNTYP